MVAVDISSDSDNGGGEDVAIQKKMVKTILDSDNGGGKTLPPEKRRGRR
jgi:hypothetical protein